MFPEKEIVGLWLNANGFLVVNDINAGKNKVIDALALKVYKGELNEVLHVEIQASVAGSSEDVVSKFNDPLIDKTIREFARKFGGDVKPKKLLVVNTPSKKGIGDIELKPFEEVIMEVMVGLDKQNYSNPVIRTIQLMKYLVISNPKIMGGVLSKMLQNKTLSRANYEKLTENLLFSPQGKRVFQKPTNLKSIKEGLSNSVVLKPAELADLALEKLSTRAFNQFLKQLFSNEKGKQFTKKTSKKQKTLKVFLE